MKAAASTPNGFIPEARGTNRVRCKSHGYHDSAKAITTNVANGCFFKGPSHDSDGRKEVPMNEQQFQYPRYSSSIEHG
jgi:hypothetical protein